MWSGCWNIYFKTVSTAFRDPWKLQQLVLIFLCVPDLEDFASSPNFREKSSLKVIGKLK